MKTTKREDRILRNESMFDVVDIAKNRGYKVYTFDSSSKYIEQIFIEDKEGRVGSCSSYYGGIQFSTVHKSKRGSGLGNGFGGLVKGQDFNQPKDLDICFISYPYWHSKGGVEKYKSFEDYKLENKILKYYEL